MSCSVSNPESRTTPSPCSIGFIVPASTLRYGSIFTRFTESPRAVSSLPIEAVAMPLPTADITPPTTKTYLCPARTRFIPTTLPRRAKSSAIRDMGRATHDRTRSCVTRLISASPTFAPYGRLAAVSGAQVAADGKITGQSSQANTSAHQDHEEQEEMSHVVFK